MYCKNCGQKIEAGQAFCKNCGTPVAKMFASTPAHAVTNKRNAIVTWIKNHKKPLIIGGIIVAVLAILIWIGSGGSPSDANASAQQSVVDVNCDNGYGGSGTIFTTDGIVLTNNHVIEGATTCKVTIPDPTTGTIKEIYEAAPVIVPTLSKEYDVATLKIDGAYTDSDGKTWGSYPTSFTPFALPSTCDPTVPSQLGDSVKIYGYPVTSGGFNLTVTTGVISSFADGGDILTSAQIDSGNSGGLAIDQNGCWLGIPSAVISGNYQNLGVIIPGAIVEKFLNSVPAKVDPAATISTSTAAASESAALPAVSSDQQCQNEYGPNSQASGQIDTSGKPTCGCQTGYAWDTTGNACAAKTSLQQACQDNYGSGSYSYVQNGQSTCGCMSGYVWNSDQSACVVAQQNNNQICQDTFGTNSQWTGQVGSNGKPECNCQTGYSWDASGNLCATQSSLNTSCENTYGVGSYSYTQSGKAVCGCSTGYTWNSGRTACVVDTSSETGYQVCSNAYPNETWDGTYTSDGKYNCVCQAGYTYNSYTQSCQ